MKDVPIVLLRELVRCMVHIERNILDQSCSQRRGVYQARIKEEDLQS